MKQNKQHKLKTTANIAHCNDYRAQCHCYIITGTPTTVPKFTNSSSFIHISLEMAQKEHSKHMYSQNGILCQIYANL